MTLIGATGLACLLSFTPKREIICANVQNRQVLGVWPFNSLRRYWHGDGMFGFEAGRRSPRGEGKFEFVTSQSERLYKKLDILTKANSPRSSKVADTRPPVPLPAVPTPPVSSASNSDEETSSSKQSKRSQTMKVESNMIEVSGTSPAYQLRRVQTVPSRGHKYLHEAIQSESENQRSEDVRNPGLPPPAAALRGEHINTRDPGVDDTYSHTVHRVPEHFQRKAMEHSAVGGSFYNALVHRQSTSSIKLKSRTGSDSDELVYDVAFQPNSMKRTLIPVTQDGEYAVAKHPAIDTQEHTSRTTTTTMTNEQQRTLEPAENPPPLRYVLTEPTEKQRINNPLYGSKEDLTDAGDDANDSGMTDNPLYGSKENLFSNEESKQSKELEVHMAALVTLGNGGSGGASNGIDDNSLTLNPIYGTSSNFATLSRERNNQEEQTASGEVESHSTTDLQTGQVRSGEESPPSKAEGAVAAGSELSTQQREATPDTIRRDAKGYSKIDKNKKINNSEENEREVEGNRSPEEDSEDEVPPPIPPRKYSMDGESPPQSMEEHQD